MHEPLRRAVYLLGACALVEGVGCSGNVASSSDASTTSMRALLSVERDVPADDPLAVPSTHASAHFLRLQAGADESIATRLVGAALSLPPVGECDHVGSLPDQGMPLASLGPVDLVNMGEVAVEAGGARATLAARAFPDVVDLVSGVLYTTRDALAYPFPSSGTYVFRVSGNGGVLPVTVASDAPGAPADVRIAGEPLRSEPLSLVRADAPITWRGLGRGDDVVYLEVTGSDPGALARVRCTFADDGAGVLPGRAIPAGTLATVALHRVHREQFRAPGIDGGQVRLDLAVTGSVRFEGSSPD